MINIYPCDVSRELCLISVFPVQNITCISGLGYIVGSEAARVMGSWHWGLRVTPIFGAIAVLLILLVVQDPPRGESEGAHLSATSWLDDIKSLGKKSV